MKLKAAALGLLLAALVNGPALAGEFAVTSALAYYKLVWNGRTEIEIDFLNMVEIVDGVVSRMYWGASGAVELMEGCA